MIYALFPETNISIHVLWGVQNQNTVFATGKSILNRTSNTNVGVLMLEYGGGGHANAGTCQIENHRAEEVLQELITRINADG
jgi:nanoRNase/pAp phosphatase (c-di-AMP/oligoRNAs hydrolase)